MTTQWHASMRRSVCFPFLRSFLYLGRIFFSPSAVFIALKQYPHWLSAFLTINFLQYAIGILALACTGRSFIPLENLSPAVYLLTLGGLLLINLVSWGFTAFVVFLLKMACTGEGSLAELKSVISVIVYSNAIFLLEYAAACFVGILNWQMGVGTTFSPSKFISLGDLLKSVPLPDFILGAARMVSAFTIWYLALLTIGLSAISALSKPKSASLVIPVWLSGLAIQLSLQSLLVE